MGIPQGFINSDRRVIQKRKDLTAKIEEILNKYGFEEGYVSMMYPLKDSFIKSGVDDRIKFLDKDGRVMCVVDDVVTGMLQSTSGDFARIYGMAEQYRLFGERRNEVCFAGVLNGVGGLEAEGEIISLGLSLWNKLSIPVGKIILGCTAVLKSVAEKELNTVGLTKSELKKLITEPLSEENGNKALAKIQEIASIKGGIEAIGSVAQNVTEKSSVDGLIGLINLSALLEEYGIDNVEFDLSYLGGEYDNGIVFAIMDKEGNILMDGGRHDYMNDNGINRAVSFRIYPDYLLSIHPELATEEKKTDIVIGIAEGTKASKYCHKLKNRFVDEGLRVTVLYKVNKDDTLAYASVFNVECAVYVDENGKAFYC